MNVVEISAADTHDLRRSVLRGGDPQWNVAFEEDTRPGSFHLGVIGDDGATLGVASFSPSPTSLRPGTSSWQLRGMAVVETVQGSGAGRALLIAAFERLRQNGAEVLWANARDSALGFYERIGMTVVGEGYLSGYTGEIPHHLVLIDF